MADSATVAIRELSRSVKASSNDTAFNIRQYASSQQSTMLKMSRDLYNVVSTNSKQVSSLNSNIADTAAAADQTSRKLDNVNSTLQQTLSLQQSLISEIQNLNAGFRSLAKAIMNNNLFGLGGGGGNGENKVSPVSAAITGFGAQGLLGALGLGGFAAGRAISGGGPQGAGQFSGQQTFASLSEDQKTQFLNNQAKAEGVRASLNNPGAMQASDRIAQKYGATAGPNNGTITLAQFPTLEAGQAAHRERWESESYRNLPLNQAINRYVTGDVNKEPAGYYKQRVGLGADPHQRDQSGANQNNSGPGGAQAGMVSLQTSKNKVEYTVDARYAPNFKGFVDELEARGYTIKTMSSHRPGSVVAETGRPSYHASGMAIDINPDKNPHIKGEAGKTFDQSKTEFRREEVSALAAKYGLGWGGDWQSSKDYMHFSAGGSEGASLGGQMNNNQIAAAGGRMNGPPPMAGMDPMMGGMMNDPTMNGMMMGAMFGGPRAMMLGGLAGALLPSMFGGNQPPPNNTSSATLQQTQETSRADNINRIDPYGMGGGMGMLNPLEMITSPIVAALSGLTNLFNQPQQQNMRAASNNYDPRVDGNLVDTNHSSSWYRELRERYPNDLSVRT
jgi:hypothetical protein